MTKRPTRKPDVSRRTFLQKAVAGAGATAAAALGRAGCRARRDGAQTGGRAPWRRFACRRSSPPPRRRRPVTLRVPDDRRAGVRARLQGRRRRGAVLPVPATTRSSTRSPRPASRRTAAGTKARWRTPPTRSSASPARSPSRSGTEGPGFTDMICAIACANAARTPLLVVASNMSIGAGRHRSRHSARLPAADDRGPEEIRQAADHPAPRARVRRLRVPAAEERRARSRCTSTSRPRSRRRGSRTRPSSSSSTTRRATAPTRGRIRRRRTSPRRVDLIRKARAADHRVEQRRVLRQGVGRAEALRREGADPGRRVGRDEGAVLRREPAVGQRRARRAGQRRPRDPGRPALHADGRRVRVRARRASTSASTRPPRTSAATCRSISASSAASGRRSRRWPTRCRRLTHDAWVAEIAAARKKFEDQNARVLQDRARATPTPCIPAVIAKELGDFLYRGKLPKEQTTIASGGYGIARYVRRELRGVPARPDHERRLSVRRDRSGRRLRRRRGRGGAARRRPAGPYKGHPIICITGDAGFGYTAMEIDTMAKYRLPVVVIVYNNNAWGTWTQAPRASRARCRCTCSRRTCATTSWPRRSAGTAST